MNGLAKLIGKLNVQSNARARFELKGELEVGSGKSYKWFSFFCHKWGFYNNQFLPIVGGI